MNSDEGGLFLSESSVYAESASSSCWRCAPSSLTMNDWACLRVLTVSSDGVVAVDKPVQRI